MFLTQLHNCVPAFGAMVPATCSVTLAWNSSPSPDVIGYHLYYGTASGIYTHDIILGNVTNVTVPGLSRGIIYYFAMAAIGPDGQESVLSNETSYRRELPSGAQVQAQAASGGPLVLTVSGTSGQTYEIEATQDFITWTVIGTVILDASGSSDFTDTNAASFQQRFYRTYETPQELPSGAQLRMQAVSGGPLVLTVSGASGRTYEIEATQDFITWTVIGTVTLDAGGSSDFTDTNAASFQQRFYRTYESP